MGWKLFAQQSHDTAFAAGKGVELVTPMCTPDGSWKVSGYFVRPAAQ